MSFEGEFYKAVFAELRRGERKGIHITHIVYDCLRRAYYSLTRSEAFDLNSGLRMWVGKKLHETKILKEHELKLEWNGIAGSVDEYGDGVLLEKKTTRNIPTYPYPHHVRQLEYYRVLLEENGRKVDKGVILYIDVNTPQCKEFIINFRRSAEEVKREMMMKKRALEMTMRDKILPQRNISWLCRYCSFCSYCFTEDGKDKRA